ncbi:hypothetical protein K443DRAFT_134673 [Laccaria amethystina LaAM-08-1]|uniref:Uncharacterized protein n=1 Tax=Laccaria amethystina LaAM-08-1 TaxID=1095629 RepID=A0A0C9X065_9AGAR|nr:hypothetical protein K443DRAFT_134673 [Laccaria amethystina LaAM-08-1]
MSPAKKAKAVGKSNINAVTATMAVVKTISSDEEMTTTAAVLPESSGEYRLHKPKLVYIAFSSEKKKMKLYYYVKLLLTSLDSVWTSCSVKAIITSGLCMPIILSLPWLELNSITKKNCTTY